MVVKTDLYGFTIELEVELNTNQEPQTKKERSLEDTDLDNSDYEIIIGVDPPNEFNDSLDLNINSYSNAFNAN